METLGGIALAIVIVYVMIKFVLKGQQDGQDTDEVFRQLNVKSWTFQSKRISWNQSTRNKDRIIKEALADPIILAELKKYDKDAERKALDEASRNHFIYNNIDVIVIFFGGEAALSEGDLKERMKSKFVNDSDIVSEIEKYESNLCISKTLFRGDIYKLNDHQVVTHPYKRAVEGSKRPLTIPIKDYLDPVKRKEFRGQEK